MSTKALSDYTVYAKYAKYLPEKQRRETWKEQVDRVFGMHYRKYQTQIENNTKLKEYFEYAKSAVLNKQVLGAQRALQFGGPAIERHNEKIYNCFSVDTQFVTSEGVKSFADFNDGDSIKVLTHTGSWKQATVKKYGRQLLYNIDIKNAKKTFRVRATRNHTWLLKQGQRTTNITVGDKLMSSKRVFDFDYDSSNPLERLYWCYGFVYGDGTTFKQKDKTYSAVRLCGKDNKFKYRFEEMGFMTSSSTSLNGDFIAFTGTYNKLPPNPQIDSPELIKAFVRGYLDADGSKNPNFRIDGDDTVNPFSSIDVSDKEHQTFVETCFPIAGVFIKGVVDKAGIKTNLGTITSGKTYYLQTTFDRDNIYGKSFNVTSITQDKEEDVWCLEVEDDHSFVLPFGVVTGNCSVTYIDRPRVFQEIMFLLLCGCGVGFSVQNKHTKNLPGILPRENGKKTFVIPDSIEGWADAIGIAVTSFFCLNGKEENDTIWSEYRGYEVEFDYSLIRPEGAPISGGFKAPGPDGLRKSIEKITELINRRLSKGETRLHNIDYYDIIMHASDAVLSGGVRRSATICLFSKDDEEMAKAKTGDWFYTNPQRGRSNNSALLLRGNTTREEFATLMKSVKDFGEPGFVWAESEDVVYNPCVEIGMMPYINTPQGRKSGVQFCNLTEINGRKCTSKEAFLEACKASAIIGTLQAGYTTFNYLGKTTEDIVRKESLLGCSITGMMDNHDVLFDPEIQREGAELIKQINKEVAEMIGINQAARTTCVKPAGSTSCLLGTSSGIHPHHARRYFRRVQANRLEFPMKEFARNNPLAVEQSVWSNNGTDMVITFLCEVPAGSITKNQLSAVDLLGKVKNTQQNWVEFGTNPNLCTEKHLRHNVSNTITVEPGEWDKVEEYIYENRAWFAGISLLPASGDKDYPQAPFCTIFTPSEIVKEYGDGSVFASGVVVNALNAFDNNLWKACDVVINNWDTNSKEQANWVRQAKQFAERYFNGDVRKMTYCLKDVHNWKTWCDLKREYKEIDWSQVVETDEYMVDINTTAGAACAGGKCEII